MAQEAFGAQNGAEGQVAEAAALQVPRALIIALGGTGRQIVTAIRRRICDRFGGVEEALPCQRYLYFDTALGDLGSDGLEDTDPPAVKIGMADRVGVTVDELQPYMKDALGWLKTVEHIREWCPEIAVTQGNIAQGAGGVRARGRLGLVWNYEKVQSSIQDVWNYLSTPLQLQTDMENARTQYRHTAVIQQRLPVQVYLVERAREPWWTWPILCRT